MDQVEQVDPQVAKAKAKAELTRRWAQDLSVCTADEMRERWADLELRVAVNEIEVEGMDFASRLENHNPLFYLAERVFFDNVLDDPEFLYLPYHRDILCKFIVNYFLDPNPAESGALFHGPRETYKSRFAHCAVPLWLLLRWKHLHNKDVRIVLRHHKEQLASANMVLLKSAIRFHPWLREVWPAACPPLDCKDFGTMTEFTLPWVAPDELKRQTEPSVIATGLTASQTGFHSDFNLNDDLVTEEHRKSKQVREDAKVRYISIRPQLHAKHGRELNTGTPYHPRDLGMLMQEAFKEDKAGNKRPVYRTMVIPSIADDGHLAHPFHLDYETLEKKRLDEIALTGHDDFWWLQYQCRTALLRTQVASSAWLRPIPIAEVPRHGMVVLPIDGAWKGTKNQGEGDSASIQVWVLQRMGGVVTRTLLDGVHSNELSSNDGEKDIFRLMAKWGAYHIAPEENGGYVFRTNLRNTATALGQRLVIIDLKMKQTQKHNRFVQFLKEVEAGRVLIASSCDPALLEILKHQIDNYHGPDTLDHDDALDAASYSCDPAIMEQWVPVWGSGLPQASWIQQARMQANQKPGDYRTRYCLS